MTSDHLYLTRVYITVFLCPSPFRKLVLRLTLVYVYKIRLVPLQRCLSELSVILLLLLCYIPTYIGVVRPQVACSDVCRGEVRESE